MVYFDRYGSEEMKALWTREQMSLFCIAVWLKILHRQANQIASNRQEFDEAHYGLWEIYKYLSGEDLESKKALNSFLKRVDHFEEKTHHELEALRQAVEEQMTRTGYKKESRLIHFACTSSDIQENAQAELYSGALQLIHHLLNGLINKLINLVDQEKGTTCAGYTHLLPAEPTTLGHRFANHLQEIHYWKNELAHFHPYGKKTIGAMGNGLPFEHFRDPSKPKPEKKPSALHDYMDINSQTKPRVLDWVMLSKLSGLALACSRLALNIRLMHANGEVMEGFGDNQVGSSAMPHKQNPILSENVCGLARLVKAQEEALWVTCHTQGLERTLDDSSVVREAIPAAFIYLEEILIKSNRIIEGLWVDRTRIKDQLGGKLWSSYQLSKLLLEDDSLTRTEAHKQIKKTVLDYSDLPEDYTKSVETQLELYLLTFKRRGSNVR